MKRARVAAATFVALGLAGGCGPRSPTQILVQVDSDMAPASVGGPLASVRVVVRREGDAPFFDQRFDLSSGYFTLPGDIAVTARAPDDTRRVLVAVTADVAGAGASSFTETVTTHFEAGHVLLLDLFLAGRCTSAANRAACTAGQTCTRDGCAPEERTLMDAPPPDAGSPPADVVAPDVGGAPDVAVGGTCGPDRADCGGARCVALLVDRDNCGACGRACAMSEVCASGACVPCANAGAGATMCGAFCRDTASDAANCGACGHACAAGEGCVAGACRRSNTTCAGAQDAVLGDGITSISDQFDPAGFGPSTGACDSNPSLWYRFFVPGPAIVYATAVQGGQDVPVGIATSCDGSGTTCSQPNMCAPVLPSLAAFRARARGEYYVESSGIMPQSGLRRVEISLISALLNDGEPVQVAPPDFTATVTSGTTDTPGSCMPGADATIYWWQCYVSPQVPQPVSVRVCPAPDGGGTTPVRLASYDGTMGVCAAVGCDTPTVVGNVSAVGGLRTLVIERSGTFTVTGHVGP